MSLLKDIDKYQGPAWDNSTEYKGYDQPDFLNDLEEFHKLTSEISGRLKEIQPLLQKAIVNQISSTEEDSLICEVQKLIDLGISANILCWNMCVFAHTEYSVNTRNPDNQKWVAKCGDLQTQLSVATQPLNQFFIRTTESFFQKLVSNEKYAHLKFYFQQERKQKDTLLEEKEELLYAELNWPAPILCSTYHVSPTAARVSGAGGL